MRSTIKRLCLSSLYAMVVLPMAAFAVDSVTLKYDVKANDFALGEAVHTVAVDGDRYSITDVERVTVPIVSFFTKAITRKSVGVIVNGQPRPTSYSETTKKETRRASLDWATKKAVFTVDPDRIDSFADNTVDRVSFAYQYYFTKKAPPSGNFSQRVADAKKVENQVFRTAGVETIDTPMGKIETIRLERAGEFRNMKLWISPKYDYLPVRIVYIDKEGRVFDQLITEIVKK